MARWKYRVYHVQPNPEGGWRVQGENALRASSRHRNKEQAVKRGRELAQARSGDVIIHREDGKIQVEYSYGDDPRLPSIQMNVGGRLGDAWDVLEHYAGTVEAPSDWAGEHDHYLYGTPKR